MSLVLHCGANPATMLALARVELPQETETFKPVAHDVIAQMALEAVKAKHDGATVRESYGMTKDGSRMFGVLDVLLDGGEHGPAYGMRNDHGKTLSSAVSGGAKVFVCDNLAFSSSGLTFFRKHTKNIMRDLGGMIVEAVDRSSDEFTKIQNRWLLMQEEDISLDHGYGVLGQAAGREVITSNQFNRARVAWRDDERHGGRTMYSLYQAFTEGAKSGNPSDMMYRYPRIDDFLTEKLRVATGDHFPEPNHRAVQ